MSMVPAKVDAAEEQTLRSSGALPAGYTPATELGWRLVQLRARSIREGGRFLTDQEVEQKIAELRD